MSSAANFLFSLFGPKKEYFFFQNAMCCNFFYSLFGPKKEDFFKMPCAAKF